MRKLVAHFGSMRTTLVLMALMGAVVLASTLQDSLLASALTAVALLLALQLLVSLVRSVKLRRHAPLLLFHLALLALGVEVGLSRLLSLDGRFELTEGQVFDGRLIDGRQGALHRGDLARARLVQLGFEIDYAPGRRRGATRNTVRWVEADGRERQTVIGDHRPLVIDGYRVSTTPNKGFAPVVRWQPTAGAAVVGSIHLPSFPLFELQQSREWHLPDGRQAWVMLDFDQRLLDPTGPSAFERPRQHRLVLRIGSERLLLEPGGRVAVPGGELHYLGLATWMGYRVSHDPLLHWLLATALLGTGALAWHYARKFRQPAPARLVPQGWNGIHHA